MATAAYRLDDPFFDHIDDLGLAYIEQPFPGGRCERAITRFSGPRIETPICLDESMHTFAAATRAIAETSVDIVTFKPGLLGPTACRDLAGSAVAAGLEVKMSGLIETSIGRSHTLALASLPGVTHTDLAPPTWFLTGDVADRRWNLVEGAFPQQTAPGIGFAPDDISLSGFVERESVISVN